MVLLKTGDTLEDTFNANDKFSGTTLVSPSIVDTGPFVVDTVVDTATNYQRAL